MYIKNKIKKATFHRNCRIILVSSCEVCVSLSNRHLLLIRIIYDTSRSIDNITKSTRLPNCSTASVANSQHFCDVEKIFGVGLLRRSSISIENAFLKYLNFCWIVYVGPKVIWFHLYQKNVMLRRNKGIRLGWPRNFLLPARNINNVSFHMFDQ